MPIMLQSALISNVFIVSQMLATRFPRNPFVKILSAWGYVALELLTISYFF